MRQMNGWLDRLMDGPMNKPINWQTDTLYTLYILVFQKVLINIYTTIIFVMCTENRGQWLRYRCWNAKSFSEVHQMLPLHCYSLYHDNVWFFTLKNNHIYCLKIIQNWQTDRPMDGRINELTDGWTQSVFVLFCLLFSQLLWTGNCFLPSKTPLTS